MGLSVESGVYITEVMPDSPAAEAKLRGDSRPSFTRPAGDGDVILALDEAGGVLGHGYRQPPEHRAAPVTASP